MVECTNTINQEQKVPTTKFYPCLKELQGRPWIQCICRLKFDLQIGAVLDECYPPQCLSGLEQRNICNLAFPETSEGAINGGERESDMYFTFRMRQREKGQSDTSIRNMGSAAFSYSYGYALFQKRRDAKSARGWTQQSFVIISELNLVGFFYRLLQQISSIITDNNCALLMQQLYEQSLLKWVEPVEAKSVQVQINLSDQTEENTICEDLVVMLPENIFQQLRQEQNLARLQFKKENKTNEEKIEGLETGNTETTGISPFTSQKHESDENQKVELAIIAPVNPDLIAHKSSSREEEQNDSNHRGY